MGQGDSHDEVPRSPTGRVPKWVMDEAAGNSPSEAVPFRAAPSTSTPLLASPRPRRRFLGVVALVVAIALVLGVAWSMKGIVAQSRDTAAALPAPAQRSAPPPGVEESPTRLAPVPVVAKPASQSFRFLVNQPESTTPATWSPCRPIHYTVRPLHAPKGGDTLITDSIAELSAATGLTFIRDSPTSEAPSNDRSAYQPKTYGDRWAPVLITWATADEVPDFGVDVAGEAGPIAVVSPNGSRTFVSGTVALDPVKFAQAKQVGGTASEQAILLHELGHLVGLAHVNDKKQLMFPSTGKVTTYQAGDLAGLAKLGSGPCAPSV